jgi:large subunit ribosomal protein L25
MKSLTIAGSRRTDMTKSGMKKLRSEGNIPCVIYGGKEPVHFAAPVLSFRKLVYTPEVFTVQVQVEGQEFNAIMRDIQFHPVNDSILHIDFLEFKQDAPVTIDIPVHIQGNSEGVKQGGRLITKVRKVKVRALPSNLPDSITLTVDNLLIGDSIRIGDLKQDGVTFLDSPNNIIVGVRVTRAVVEETPAAAAATTAAGAAPAAAGAAPAAGAKAAPGAAAPAAAKAPAAKK